MALEYTKVSPPETDPKYWNPHFSTVNMTEAMYVKSPSDPKIFVETPFGDNTPQATLREDYESLAKKPKVVAMVPFKVDEATRTWAKKWEDYAASYVDDTTHAAKSRKKKGAELAFHNFLNSNSEYDNPDIARIKMTVPDNVLRALQESIPDEHAFGKTIFDIPRAIYKLCFKVSGVWRSATSYGLSFKIVRFEFVKVLAIPKRALPEDFLFPDEEEDEDEVEDSQK